VKNTAFFGTLFLSIIMLTAPQSSSSARDLSSETLDARKGVFRLLSADVQEESAYHIRTSIQYFRDDDLLKDSRTVEAASAGIGFGYAVFPYLYLSAHGGLDIASRDLGAQSQTYNLFRFSSAVTSTYDVGELMGLAPRRLLLGGSLWIDFSRITRFFKGVNIVPTLIASSDWSEQQVPVRAHLNLGFQPGNGGRYFDSGELDEFGNPAVKDFDRFATRTYNSFAANVGTGVEFPFEVVIPSAEFHMQYVKDAGFSDSPKWVTLGLKGKPFPQKNIELFSAVDLGLSGYSATPATQKPASPAVPLWNVVVGFGLSQFGKRATEVAVDSRQYERTVAELRERNETLADLRRDLSYNTVAGKVIDAETKKPISGVRINFPEQANIRAFETDRDGNFRRYFPHLEGARMQFSKDGYEPSSKFLALQPGESIRADVELRKGDSTRLGSLVLTITDEDGESLSAQIVLRNTQTNEQTTATADELGKLNLQVPEGEYSIEIRAQGFVPRRDRISIEAGRSVLRTYAVTKL